MERTLPSGVRQHRAAEIVSSQGTSGPASPQPKVPYLAEDWRYRSRTARSSTASFQPVAGSFAMPNGIASTGGRGPRSSSFHEMMSSTNRGHLACTAAARGQTESGAPTLCMSMQRGMSCDEGNPRPVERARSFEPPRTRQPSFEYRGPARIRQESPGRMISALNYQGAPDDAIDQIVATQCRQLRPDRAKALLIRRIALGEYEVDGAPVRLSWGRGDCNSGEVVVSTPGYEHEGSEPLPRYLARAAETALARAPPDHDVELPSFPWGIDLNRTVPAVPLMQTRPHGVAVHPGLGAPVTAAPRPSGGIPRATSMLVPAATVTMAMPMQGYRVR
jgi:hypothetical protein